jgi:alanyl-tRNA synthetase
LNSGNKRLTTSNGLYLVNQFLLASVASQYTATLKAGDIIKHLATELGGKGGGKPDL